MNRHDSGFDETFRLKDFEHDAPSIIHRSNTAPTRHRRPKRTSPNASNSHPTAMDTQRPASEKPTTTTHHKQPSSRRKSITSSSSNSTNNTRRRGYGSIPSSRRTSCTMVDPSRPARHYRIKSSQTCPTNRDIDDVLALHFRSCSLFQNPTHQSANPGLTISGYGPSADAEFGSRPVTAPHTGNDSIAVSPLTKESEEWVAPIDVPDTTMHWMSPCTRKTQYEKIDRANSGLRGLLRKIVPRCVSGPPAQTFYNDKSDAGSVRRYRVDVSDDDEVDEKSTAALRMQRRKLERTSTQKPETKKLWGCF